DFSFFAFRLFGHVIAPLISRPSKERKMRNRVTLGGRSRAPHLALRRVRQKALTGGGAVFVIGARRGSGLETVKAALAAGHSVRALARSARRIPVDHPKLEKMAGDALEMTTVKRALTGIDAVTQSLGVSAGPEIILKPTRLFSKATQILVTAMQ